MGLFVFLRCGIGRAARQEDDEGSGPLAHFLFVEGSIPEGGGRL